MNNYLKTVVWKWWLLNSKSNLKANNCFQGLFCGIVAKALDYYTIVYEFEL